MDGELLEWTTADGARLGTYRWRPTGTPRATFQLVHGMAEHLGRYGELAAELVERGFLVFGHDHRGHGRSARSTEDLGVRATEADPGAPLSAAPDGVAEPPPMLGHIGDAGSWERLVLDVHEHGARVALEHPGVPRVILGHSMGGYVVQDVLGRFPTDADAWVLSGNRGRPPRIEALGRLVARLERTRLGARGHSALIRRLTFGRFNAPFERRTPFDWLSSDPERVDAYVADPLCGFDVSVGTWVELLGALPRLTTAAHLARVPRDTPILVVAGGDDTSIGGEAGADALIDDYQRSGLARVEASIWPNGRHEMLQETCRADVARAIAEWATAHGLGD